MKPRKQSDATKLRHARSQIRNCQNVIDALRMELARRRLCGGRMANICFNGAQAESVPVDYRQSMRSRGRGWDAIKRVDDDRLYFDLFGGAR